MTMAVLLKTDETLAAMQQAHIGRSLNRGNVSQPALVPPATYQLFSHDFWRVGNVGKAGITSNAIVPGHDGHSRIVVLAQRGQCTSPSTHEADGHYTNRVQELMSRVSVALGGTPTPMWIGTYVNIRNANTADAERLYSETGQISIGRLQGYTPPTLPIIDQGTPAPEPGTYKTRPATLESYGLVVYDPVNLGQAVAVLTKELIVLTQPLSYYECYTSLRMFNLILKAIEVYRETIPSVSAINAVRKRLMRAENLRKIVDLIRASSHDLSSGAADAAGTMHKELVNAQNKVLEYGMTEQVVSRVLEHTTALMQGGQIPELEGLPDGHPLRNVAHALQREIIGNLTERVTGLRQQRASQCTKYVVAAERIQQACGLSNNLDTLPERLADAIERIGMNEEIEEISVTKSTSGHCVEIQTRMIQVRDPRTGILHDTGRFKLHVPLSFNPSNIHVYNRSWHCQWRGPHVMSTDTFCYGTALADVQTSLQTFDMVGLIAVLLAFMHSVNVNDSAGKCIWQFPICKEEADRIGLPGGLRNPHFSSRNDVPYTMLPHIPRCI